jgi:hypothetical protein
MLPLNTPTASMSWQVTTLPRISVRILLGRLSAYTVHSEPTARLILADKLAGSLFLRESVIGDVFLAPLYG